MLAQRIYFLPGVLRREWKQKEEIEKIISKMLKSLLGDVYRINSFYKEKFKGLSLEKISDSVDLSTLPLTSKDELREAFPQSLSRGYAVENCIHDSTSGSTGDVLNIYHDRVAGSYYDCISFRQYRGFGYRFHYKIAYTRFEPHKRHFTDYFGLFRRYHVPVDCTPAQQLGLLMKYQAEVISGYPTTLYEIAQLVEDGVPALKPKFIVSHSEILTGPVRAFIESVFGCRVYNDYSSFEVYGIAGECSDGCMHVHVDNNIVEIIKDGEPASPGETGEIVVTNLMNRAMPFIRYRTGDIGVFDEDTCTCGRGLPVLKSMEGRKDEYLRLPSGGTISPRVFDPLDLIFHRYVSKFQIVQREKGRFLIKVVRRKNYTDEVSRLIVQEAKRSFPEPIEVEIEEVDDISRTGRGKMRAVICEVGE